MIDKFLFRSQLASKGITQSELAKKIGISENTLSSKINGHSYFNTNEIEKACRVLEIADSKTKAKIFLGESSNLRDETSAKKKKPTLYSEYKIGSKEDQAKKVIHLQMPLRNLILFKLNSYHTYL